MTRRSMNADAPALIAEPEHPAAPRQNMGPCSELPAGCSGPLRLGVGLLHVPRYAPRWQGPQGAIPVPLFPSEAAQEASRG